MALPIAEFVTPFQQLLRADVTVLRLVEFISITKRATYLLKYNKTYIPCSTRHSSSRELNFQRWRFLRVDDNKNEIYKTRLAQREKIFGCQELHNVHKEKKKKGYTVFA